MTQSGHHGPLGEEFADLTRTLAPGRVQPGVSWDNFSQPEFFAFDGLNQTQKEVVLKALNSLSSVKKSPQVDAEGLANGLLERIIRHEEHTLEFDAIQDYCQKIRGLQDKQQRKARVAELKAQNSELTPPAPTQRREVGKRVYISYYNKADGRDAEFEKEVDDAVKSLAMVKHGLSEDELESRHFRLTYNQGFAYNDGKWSFAQTVEPYTQPHLTAPANPNGDDALRAALGALTEADEIVIAGHGNKGRLWGDSDTLAFHLKQNGLRENCHINVVACVAMHHKIHVDNDGKLLLPDGTKLTQPDGNGEWISSFQRVIAEDNGPLCEVSFRRLPVIVGTEGRKTTLGQTLPVSHARLSKLHAEIERIEVGQNKTEFNQSFSYHVYAKDHEAKKTQRPTIS